jgi:hypothetical protein
MPLDDLYGLTGSPVRTLVAPVVPEDAGVVLVAIPRDQLAISSSFWAINAWKSTGSSTGVRLGNRGWLAS